MMVKLGENGIKSIEDLAGCASDDLQGYTEMKGTERVRIPGALEDFDLTQAESNDIIMKARVKAGWISEADLQPQEPEQTEPASA
jgi:N utilization substance protein A